MERSIDSAGLTKTHMANQKTGCFVFNQRENKEFVDI